MKTETDLLGALASIVIAVIFLKLLSLRVSVGSKLIRNEGGKKTH